MVTYRSWCVAILGGGGGDFIGPHLTGISTMPMLAWAWCGNENDHTLLTSMATPKPTQTISVSRRVAMTPCTLPQ